MNLKSFWEKDEESPFTLEKIDEEQIREAEGTLGVTLPDTYKKLILEWNGGFTVRNAFPTDRRIHGQRIMFNSTI